MTVSIPLVVIFGILVFVAYRYMGLRAWHAIVALIFGFLLPATTAAPRNPEPAIRPRQLAEQAIETEVVPMTNAHPNHRTDTGRTCSPPPGPSLPPTATANPTR